MMRGIRRAQCRCCGPSCSLKIYSLSSDGFDRKYPQNWTEFLNFKNDGSFLSN